jgi:hypothetical protein
MFMCRRLLWNAERIRPIVGESLIQRGNDRNGDGGVAVGVGTPDDDDDDDIGDVTGIVCHLASGIDHKIVTYEKVLTTAGVGLFVCSVDQVSINEAWCTNGSDLVWTSASLSKNVGER